MLSMKSISLAAVCLMVGIGLVSCDAKKTSAPETSASSASAAHADEARTWLITLYANYTNGGNVTFSPLGDQAATYFDTEMLALMEKDRQATPADEVGALDGDPICDCQDFGSLNADITTQVIGPDKVKATVILNETSPDFAEGTPPKAPAPRTLVYELVKTAGGWRIHDIAFPQGGSLRETFISAQSPAG
jgi:hypothetical protein